MIKVITKYLISFCCLLILGQGVQLYTHSHSPDILSSSVRSKANCKSDCVNSTQEKDVAFTQYTSHDVEKRSRRLNIFLFENEESNESSSGKKYPKNENSYISNFPSQIPTHLLSYNNVVTLNKYLSSTLACKYLLFGVFKI